MESSLTIYTKNFNRSLTFDIAILLIIYPEEKIRHTCKDMSAKI